MNDLRIAIWLPTALLTLLSNINTISWIQQVEHTRKPSKELGEARSIKTEKGKELTELLSIRIYVKICGAQGVMRLMRF